MITTEKVYSTLAEIDAALGFNRGAFDMFCGLLADLGKPLPNMTLAEVIGAVHVARDNYNRLYDATNV